MVLILLLNLQPVEKICGCFDWCVVQLVV